MAFSWSAPASVLAVLLAAASCPAEGFFVPASQSFGHSLLQQQPTHDAASPRTRAPAAPAAARVGKLSSSSSDAGASVCVQPPHLCWLLQVVCVFFFYASQRLFSVCCSLHEQRIMSRRRLPYPQRSMVHHHAQLECGIQRAAAVQANVQAIIVARLLRQTESFTELDSLDADTRHGTKCKRRTAL